MAKPASNPDAQGNAGAAWAGFSDSELVRDCLSGKEAAWAGLIGKYKNLIFSIPVKYGFSREDASDIFQSVCVELLSELPKLRESKALPGWLIQVTSHKCFHKRREQQRYSADEPQETSRNNDSGDMQESILVQLEREQMLREALATLTPRCQRLMHELFFHDPPRPYEEVAKGLGLATGSIGFIRGRCMEKLRASLNKMGFGD